MTGERLLKTHDAKVNRTERKGKLWKRWTNAVNEEVKTRDTLIDVIR